jgi:hypothetical protein
MKLRLRFRSFGSFASFGRAMPRDENMIAVRWINVMARGDVLLPNFDQLVPPTDRIELQFADGWG